MSTYNFNDHIKGDTFRELIFNISKNGTAMDLSQCSIKMHLRIRPEYNIPALSLSTDEGITIDPVVAGRFAIDEQIIDIPAANYYYDIEFNFTDDDTIRTYISGRFNIVQDITWED